MTNEDFIKAMAEKDAFDAKVKRIYERIDEIEAKIDAWEKADKTFLSRLFK